MTITSAKFTTSSLLHFSIPISWQTGPIHNNPHTNTNPQKKKKTRLTRFKPRHARLLGAMEKGKNKQASLLFMLLEWYFFLFEPASFCLLAICTYVCNGNQSMRRWQTQSVACFSGTGRWWNVKPLKPPVARIKSFFNWQPEMRISYARKSVNFSTRHASKFICVPRGVCVILTLMRRMAWTISARVFGRGTSSQPTNCNGYKGYLLLLNAQTMATKDFHVCPTAKVTGFINKLIN